MCVSALTQRQFLKSFLIGLLLIASTLQSVAQIRLTKVDVANDKVIIKNFGGSAVDISGYWFCHSFTYHQVSDGTIVTGSSNLAAGAQVELTLAQSLNNAGSDLSFYTSPSFGSSGAMIDFTQWGSGGNGRENVAVAKGIWTAGQFVNVTSTTIYYGGSGSENGLAQWSTIPHPSVTSIVRQTPTDATTDADQVVFRVTFDRGVQNVDVSDFSISGTAAGDGTVNSVSAVSNSVYDVTITGVTNSAGTINLDINGSGSTAGINTIIADPLILDQNQPNGGNTINRSEFGQSFTANNTGVVSSVTLNVSGASTYTGAATMELRSGDGLSGGVLATETINITSGSGEKNFTFTTPGNVTSGSQYTIRFTGPGTFSSEFVVTATQGDPLSGGVIYQPTALASADLTVKIFVTSGGQGGLTSTAPGTDETYTIQNNLAPTATNVTFTGTLEVGQQLSGTYTWADADNGDTESGTAFKWYRSDDASGTNKTAIPSATAQTYTLTNDDKLKFISFEVTPNDGITAGTPVESVRQLVATIFINSVVRHSPTDATTGDDEVTFRVTFSDDVRFVTTDDFVLSGTAAGDGTVSSVTNVSSGVYDVKVTGVANSTGTINLDLKGVDASGSNDIAKIPTQPDASSTADLQITDSPVFGQSFQPVNTGLLVDVVLKNGEGHSYSGPGTLELISGEGYGGAVLATENIQITAPLGEKTYSFSNAPSVTAGTTYTIRVNVPGGSTSNMAFSAQVGAGYPNGVLYQASVFSSADLYFKLFVSSGPSEPLGNTLPSTDETYTILNPPVASNVMITGTLSVGELLTGTYDFTDPQTDTESGSTFKWYSADNAAGSNKTAIAGATAKTYTITQSDIGKFLSFEVTPSDGTDTGVAEESPAQEVATPVTIQSVTRHTPSTSGISSATNPVFRVTFSEGVRNVTTEDFVLNSAVGGVINTVTPVDVSTYDVAVNNLNNADGALGLKVKGIDGATGTNNITSIAYNNGVAAHQQTTENDYLNQALIGQSFTSASNNYLSAFTMFPRAGTHAFTGTARLRVFQGDASNSSVLNDANAVLSEETVSISSSTAATGQTFTISSPSQLTSGAVYSIVLDNFTGSGTRAFNAHTSGSLSNGRAFFTGSNNTSHAAFDFMIDIFEGTQIDGDALFDQAAGTNETYTVTGNVAPTVTAVSFTGTIKVGQQLSGTYTWADTDAGDTESGSIFQWYRADDASGTNKTAITGATAQTYTLVAIDAHKFISFAVVPGDGTNTGLESESALSQVLNSGPTFTSTAITTVNDNATYSYSISTNDEDGDAVGVTATTKPSWLTLTSTNVYVTSTLAGSGSGFNDATGTDAQFANPNDVAVDASGNVYVADFGNHKIRKITPAGVVSTFAGSTQGFNDATGTTAQFDGPRGVAVDAAGNVYVVDNGNNKIRKITPTGIVSTFAGSTQGFNDATGTDAQFNQPYDVEVDESGNVIVADTGNQRIRKISSSGVVTTLAGNASASNTNGTGTSASFDNPLGVALDAAGNVFVADGNNHLIRKITPTGVVTTLAGSGIGFSDGTGTGAKFNFPWGIAVDALGNVFVADASNAKIRKITSEGVVSTVAGANGGFMDGTGTNAQFNFPGGIDIDASDNLFVADGFNTRIRKIEVPKTILSGDATGQTAGDYDVILTANDGNGGTATQTFSVTVVDVTSPVLTSAPTAGDFAENGTGTVYTVTATDVNTLTYSLGTGDDNALFNIDGSTGAVTFKTAPDFEIPSDQGGDNGYVINVIATDEANNATNQNVTFSVTNVSDVNPVFTSTAITTVNDNATYTYDITTNDADGDDVTLTATTTPGWLSLNQTEKGVSTLSGTGLNKSGGNGPGTGVAQDGSLNAASFSWPSDIVIDDQENIYVLDRFEGKLRKIASDGNVTTIAGSEFGTQLGTGTNAKLKYPEAMALGNNNIMYVPSGFSRDAEDFIRKIDVTTGAVTAFAGGLKGVSGLAYDKTADILYASQVGLSGEHEILMFDTQGNKTVLAGNGTGFVNGTGTEAKFNYPGDLLLDGNGNLYVSDQGNNSIRRVDLVTKVVATVAGGSRGSNDGTGTDAQFSGPYGLAMDSQSNLYVADRFNYVIRKIDPNGVVTTVTGIKGESADLNGSLETAKFYDPDGLTIDSQGNLLVTDQYTSKIRKISLTTSLTLTGDATGQTAGDYDVTLTASDGNSGTATQTFSVTVVDVTSPVLTSATTAGDFAENGTGTVYTAVATDANVFTYGLGSGNDENVFNIDENTGVVTFKDIPDFENPFDQGSDNGYVINVIATDAANNAANQNVTIAVTDVDDTQPSVSITSTSSVYALSSFDVTITFSEDVTGFAEADITVNNGTVSSGSFAGSGKVYTATIIGTVEGHVHVDVAADVAVDAANNGNTAATSFAIINDPISPSITITSDAANPQSGAFVATFTFNEDVTGFTADDIDVGNGTVDNFSASDAKIYTATITPAADGDVTIDVPLLAATDLAGNLSNAAIQLVVTNDETRPTVTITSNANDPQSGGFSAIITFSEDVTGFALEDLTVGNGTASTFQVGSARLYTASIIPLADGVVTIDVAADKAIDAAGNTNTAATQLTVINDEARPTVTITSDAADSQSGAFTATFTFSEDVTGFEVGDISVDNGAADNFNATSTSIYTATITPAADGAVTVDLAANKADDLAGNGNRAATQLSVTNDESVPTVSITSSADPTSGAFTATFTFSEEVIGFTADDITIGNGASSNFNSTGASIYTVTITPLSDGAVTVDVAADKATDAAGNSNTAATQLSVTNDETQPTVTIASDANDPQSGGFSAIITFSEDVTGFALEDLTIGNGTASTFQVGSARLYTASIIPLADGVVTIDVAADKAIDVAGNNNTAAVQLTVINDEARPTVTITSDAKDPQSGVFTATFTFSEDVTGFEVGDISVDNGAASNFSTTSASVYTATITPAADGPVTVDLAANKADDLAGNGNVVATQLSVTNDESVPTINITSSADPTSGAFTSTFTFSEDVTGFALEDITIGNGVASNFNATSASVYTAIITPSADGAVTVDVDADKAVDAAGNGNTTATQLSVNNDGTQPTVTISSDANPVSGAFTATFTFSEDVTGFELEDITVGNGTAGIFNTTGASVYTATITPSADGAVTVDVDADIAADAAGNSNTAATQLSVNNDGTQPTVTISSDANPTRGVFTATFSFSEDVTGFALEDITVDNGAASNFNTTSASVYTATITPSADGEVTVDLAADKAIDAAGNGNTAATQLSVTNDETQPTVTISSDASDLTNIGFDITITFSEDVTGFDLTDLVLANGSAGDLLGAGAVYMATITPAADGLVTIDLGAGVAQDAAGNDNTPASQFSIQADITAPVAPEITGISEDTGSDSADGITSDNTLTFSGTAEASSSVEIFINGSTIGTTTTDGTGNWTYDHTGVALIEADYNVTATATDAANNTSALSSVLAVTIDQTVPANPVLGSISDDTGISNTDIITNDPTIIYSGTGEPFASIKIGAGPFTLQTTTADANGDWTADVTHRPFNSSITIFITATDAAGNVSSDTNTFQVTIDTIVPTVQSINRADANPTAASSVDFTVTFSEEVHGLSTSSFSLALTDTQNASIASLSASSGTSITVTVDNITGEGSFGLNLSDITGITDVAGNSLSGTFTGEVYQTNFSPTDISLSTNSILENNTVGDVIGTLSTTDQDVGNTHSYSFVTGTGDADNASFTITGNELKAAEVFDLEAKADYTIRIQTDDGRGGSFEKAFTITIDNVAEADLRITGNDDIPATPLGITTNFDITLHNDGDATLTVSSILYPTAFGGPVSGISVAPSSSEVVTLSFTPVASQVYSGDITIETNGGTGILAVSANGAIITSIDNGLLKPESIKLYPNPATDIVTIDLSEYNGRALEIQLFDMSGIKTFNINEYKKSILKLDVSGYHNGLYLVQFTDGKSTVQKKIMIRK